MSGRNVRSCWSSGFVWAPTRRTAVGALVTRGSSAGSDRQSSQVGTQVVIQYPSLPAVRPTCLAWKRSHVGAAEPLEGLAGRRASLALIARAVDRRAVRVLRRGAEPEEAQLADLHPRPELDRQRGDVAQLESDVPAEPRIDEPGRRVGE